MIENSICDSFKDLPNIYPTEVPNFIIFPFVPCSIIKPTLERCRFKLGPSSFELCCENTCELSHLLVTSHWFLAQRENTVSSSTWWTDRVKSCAQRVTAIKSRIKQISTRECRHSIANLEGVPTKCKVLSACWPHFWASANHDGYRRRWRRQWAKSFQVL